MPAGLVMAASGDAYYLPCVAPDVCCMCVAAFDCICGRVGCIWLHLAAFVAALSSLRYADFWALSATGCVPLSALVKYVAVCVRVCWYCHQSGGTDVVDLPDILLPAGQYLDLFDSESETDVPSDSSDEELVEV